MTNDTTNTAAGDEVAELRAIVTRLTNRVNELEDQLLDGGIVVDDDAPPYAAPPRMADLEQWVTQVFARMFCRRPGPQQRWCKHWWLHPEAVWRLDGVWRAYEAYRREDPELGTANWTRDYLDPALAVLFSPLGPFAACTPDRHEHDADLPLVPPEIGMFAETDTVEAGA